MKKVLIYAPPSFVGEWVKKAFIANEWESQLITYEVSQNYSYLNNFPILRHFIPVLIQRQFNATLEKRVIGAIRGSSPNLFLIIKGYRPSRQNSDRLNDLPCRFGVWTIDSVSRYPGQGELARLADWTFYMDGGDVQPHTSSWLPLGYDQDSFRPSADSKLHDVLIIGNMRPPEYATRRRILTVLGTSTLARSYRFAFAGTTGSRAGDAKLKTSLSVDFLGRLSIEKYAEVIARSHIVVNIHQDDGIQPVNPTFFAIPGSGVCQLSDRRDYLDKWLTRDRHYIATDPQNVLETIGDLLPKIHNGERFCTDGMIEAQRNHTMIDRVRHIIRTMEC